MKIQWFPGHMARAEKELRRNLKLVDMVFILVDARIPISSSNPSLTAVLGKKPGIIILNKSDLADPVSTKIWVNWFHARGMIAVAVDLVSGRGIKRVFTALGDLLQSRTGLLKHGAGRPGLPRCMVMGIPNVGKSTFINRLAGHRSARTGRLPGVTRGPQWICSGEKLEILDTPGILWPRLDDGEMALKLAATGAIKKEVFDSGEVTRWILGWLIRNQERSLKDHFQLEDLTPDSDLLLEMIGKKRGLLAAGGIVDRLRTADHILKEFREGKLGRFTLEVPCEEERPLDAQRTLSRPAQV